MLHTQYCTCGDKICVSSDADTIADIFSIWNRIHSEPPHGICARSEAANSRRTLLRQLRPPPAPPDPARRRGMIKPK